MDEEKIASLKGLVKNLEENLDNLKEAMKEGNEEKFKNTKESSNGIMKKIEGMLSSKDDKKKGEPKND